MAHFAELDENNVVINVTSVHNDVLKDENGIEQESLGLEHLKHLGGRWVQTSYNNNFRNIYAGIGYKYDEENDVFIQPQPYESWTLNIETFKWEPPIPKPEENINELYIWDEGNMQWINILNQSNI